jgi:hypothetical protein
LIYNCILGLFNFLFNSFFWKERKWNSNWI